MDSGASARLVGAHDHFTLNELRKGSPEFEELVDAVGICSGGVWLKFREL
jgi:hypothetical protein